MSPSSPPKEESNAAHHNPLTRSIPHNSHRRYDVGGGGAAAVTMSVAPSNISAATSRELQQRSGQDPLPSPPAPPGATTLHAGSDAQQEEERDGDNDDDHHDNFGFGVDEDQLAGTTTEPFPAHDAHIDPEGIPYQEPADDTALLPPPPPADFRPFFTLVEDRATGQHHHPTVHYLFADDDPELATAAALDSLAVGPTGSGGADVEERCVIVDIGVDGKTVTGVSSLSPEWQALRTTVSQAPSWGADEGKAQERGLMLRVSGQTVAAAEGKGVAATTTATTAATTATAAAAAAATEKGKERGGSGADLDDMIRAFDARLCDLDGVLTGKDTQVVS